MYPIIEIIPWWLHIYVFGVAMSIAFLLFFYLVNHLANQVGVQRNIFSDIITFSLAILIFWRLFYILAEWREFGTYFQDIRTYWKDILLMREYSISLMGGMLGFFLVFYWKTREYPRDRKILLDVATLSFFIPAIIGYIGAFFWGQIYGQASMIGLAPDPVSGIIGSTGPIFPLALFYAFFCFLIFFFLLSLRKKQTYHGFIAFTGMALYGWLLFLGEFLNGSSDMFQAKTLLTLSQIGGIIFMIYGMYGILKKMQG